MQEVEDIKSEDLHPNLGEAFTETSAFKKFKRYSDKLVAKINHKINAERNVVRTKMDSANTQMQNAIDKFVKDTNEDLARFKKRYEAMYTDLVRRILLKMEQRLFSAEIFEQATLDLCIEKIYRLEKGLKPEGELDKIDYGAYIEDCAAAHEGFMQKHADEFAKRQKEEQDVAVQTQEDKSAEGKNSGGDKDTGSSEVNTENSGAADRENGGETEPTPEASES